MDANLAGDFALAELADRAGFEKSWFSRRFKEYTGKSPFRYILHKRLEKAMFLLRTTDQRVGQIATACGFRDISNFNHLFRREIGLSPGQYR
jgi:transcriptional regulator GlxA family with amidase domain